jgi:hypothetical protein
MEKTALPNANFKGILDETRTKLHFRHILFEKKKRGMANANDGT